MKAIIQEGYGSPDVPKLREVATPSIDDTGVLVQVHAASVNAYDWHVTRGMPYVEQWTRTADAHARILDEIRQHAGVTAAGASNFLPFVQFTSTPVPEPATGLLAGAAALAAGAALRRRTSGRGRGSP